MTVHMQKEIDHLKKQILSMGTVVEEAINKSIYALMENDRALAEEVIENDTKVNNLEITIEEDCLKILALYQPVAIDLRFITAVMKMNNDLERMGDLAVNVAERVAFIVDKPSKKPKRFNFKNMAGQVQKMVRNSLDALVNRNADLARQVCGEDDIVDDSNREMYRIAKEEIKKDPAQTGMILHLLSISRHLERIADLATNLAEDVVYMVEGEIIRHQTEDYRNNDTE